MVVLLFFALYVAFCERQSTNGWEYKPKFEEIDSLSSSYDIPNGVLPTITDSTYTFYSNKGRYYYCYNTDWLIPNWVAYRLTRDEVVTNKVKRTNAFRRDSAIIAKGWRQASTNDYYRSNYNRGHLIPSADRNDSRQENRATFTFANIVPQVASVNSGVWLKVEHKVREWAYRYSEAYIVVGTIAAEPHKYIGHNRVVVPNSMYKAIVVNRDNKWYGVAYIVPNNRKVRGSYKKYQMSIDNLEQKLGVDIFPHIEKFADNDFEKRVSRKIFK